MRWLLISTVVVLMACSGGGEEQGKSRRGGMGGGMGRKGPAPVTVVEVETIGRGEVADVLITSAVVESERQADLVPQAAGTVLEVRVDDGDFVRRGQTLAVIDNVSLDTSATRAQADLSKAQREYATAVTLHEKGALSDRELRDAEHLLTTSRASLREAGASQGQTRLTAPFDGVVASRQIRVGSYASNGTAAFQLVDLSALRVIASLPERDLSRVTVGQTARLVSAYDEALSTAGIVERVAPVVDSASGTFRVTISLPPDQQTLRPGQFVSVELEVDRHQGVVVVPRRAVVYEDGSPVVYTMIDAPKPDEKAEAEAAKKAKGDKKSFFSSLFSRGGDEKKEHNTSDGPVFVASRHRLELGLVDAQWAEVVEGVDEGAAVITLGQSNLKDEAPVKTPEMVEADEAKRKAEEEANKAEAEAKKGGAEAATEGEAEAADAGSGDEGAG